MSRLTKSREDDYGCGTKMYYTNGKISSGIVYIDDNKNFTNMAIDKLGQLEDIEDELGIDLITLFKILKTKECYSKKERECLIIGITNNGVILMPKKFLYGEREFVVPFTELGKTWALTKEELL